MARSLCSAVQCSAVWSSLAWKRRSYLLPRRSCRLCLAEESAVLGLFWSRKSRGTWTRGRSWESDGRARERQQRTRGRESAECAQPRDGQCRRKAGVGGWAASPHQRDGRHRYLGRALNRRRAAAQQQGQKLPLGHCWRLQRARAPAAHRSCMC